MTCQHCVYYHMRIDGIDWCGARPEWRLHYNVGGIDYDYIKPCSLVKLCGYCTYKHALEVNVAEVFGVTET